MEFSSSKKGISNFLKSSFAIIGVICIAVFSFILFYMKDQSSQAISEVGNLYMSAIAQKNIQNFENTINLRLSQVKALLVSVPPDHSVNLNDEQVVTSLTANAKSRDFVTAQFCLEDGHLQEVFGGTIDIKYEKLFMDSIKDNQTKIAVATTSEGEKVVVFSVPARYYLENGLQTIALIAGIPIDDIKETLFSSEDNSIVSSFLVRQDGSFVIRGLENEQGYEDGFYTFMENQTAGTEETDAALSKLRWAASARTDYTCVITGTRDTYRIYENPIPNSEWVLITMLPFGHLNSVISNLSSNLMIVGLIGAAVILVIFVFLFIGYYRLTQVQMRQLAAARKEAEEANRAKSEFLSNMSHDIRTPMNAIVGMTAIATSNIGNKERVLDCLKKITLSSRHLLGLINDILDMSKIESGKLTLNTDAVSLKEVIDSVVNIAQPQVNAKHQSFDVYISNIDYENVYCDSLRLNQIFINLISNAIKFTPEKGAIRIRVYEKSSEKGDDYIQLHFIVSDTGIGMSQDFVKVIFDSFSREDDRRVNKTEGSGLGMAITKYIVDAMDGTIKVDSVLGEGSTFHVTLDLKKAPDKLNFDDLPNWKILVIDDDEILCESATENLKEIGLQADWALESRSALEMVRRHHDMQDDYDVILIDWKLPGKDGVKTAKEIREILGHTIPIILITAYDWSEIEEEARQAGVNGFIAKPLFKSTLYAGLLPYAAITDIQKETILPVKPDYSSLKGKKILIAEDNEINWEIASELLESEGLETVWAEDGKQAVEIYKHSKPHEYAAILMDLRMPIMDGYEAAMAIRSLNRQDANIPILAMTADAFTEDVQKCLKVGMNAHIAKPINIDEVLELLLKYIGTD